MCCAVTRKFIAVLGSGAASAKRRVVPFACQIEMRGRPRYVERSDHLPPSSFRLECLEQIAGKTVKTTVEIAKCWNSIPTAPVVPRFGRSVRETVGSTIVSGSYPLVIGNSYAVICEIAWRQCASQISSPWRGRMARERPGPVNHRSASVPQAIDRRAGHLGCRRARRSYRRYFSGVWQYRRRSEQHLQHSSSLPFIAK